MCSAVILCYGVGESSLTNIIVVAVKIIVLLMFIFTGIGYMRSENFTPFVPPNRGTFGEFGWSGVIRGAGKIFFAYIGFDSVSTVAQEARNPQRDMPIGILGSLGICTVLYIATSLVLCGMVPYAQLTGAHPLTLALNLNGVTWASTIISIGALAGLTSVTLASLLGQTRIFYSMSADGLLPKAFSVIHPRYQTPVTGTLFIGGFSALLAGIVPLEVLGDMTSMGTLAAFVLVSISVVVLRRTAPDHPRAFLCPWVPAIPILGSLVCLLQMAFLDWKTWMRCIVWWLIGMTWYAWHAHHHGIGAQMLAAGADGAPSALGGIERGEFSSLSDTEHEASGESASDSRLGHADVYGDAGVPHPDGEAPNADETARLDAEAEHL
jgi:APA family basic amino acid/polyamine antiporter